MVTYGMLLPPIDVPTLSKVHFILLVFAISSYMLKFFSSFEYEYGRPEEI
jgi:hypothetical protein